MSFLEDLENTLFHYDGPGESDAIESGETRVEGFLESIHGSVAENVHVASDDEFLIALELSEALRQLLLC